MPARPNDLVLFTIPMSHYCEKARWAFERAGVAYREEGHLPLLSRLAGRRRGVWHSVPILFAPEGPVPDSTAILKWVDERVAPERRLYPADPAARAEVERWEELFDERLGPHTRRVAYGWILPDRRLSLDVIGSQPVPRSEKWLARASFPVMRAIMRRGLEITPASVARSLDIVDEIYDEVGRALADGRRYLVGGRFSAADLTFAALAAPLLAPPAYGAPLPGPERLPEEARARVERLRATPAGRWALRVYDEDRPRTR